jgi:hypothetical protein
MEFLRYGGDDEGKVGILLKYGEVIYKCRLIDRRLFLHRSKVVIGTEILGNYVICAAFEGF